MKKIQKNKKKMKKVRKIIAAPVKKRWILRKKTFSPYPYIITISYYKTNIFFTVADIQGQTKMWTSTGRAGFKNKDKTTYMAVVRVTEIFYKRLWNWGVRSVLFKFHNLYKKSTRFAVRHSMRKFRSKFALKYIGFLARTQISFNGCRKKKQRRK